MIVLLKMCLVVAAAQQLHTHTNWGPLVGVVSGQQSPGIVVPKRSALIMGLDRQFKQRANKQQQAAPTGHAPPVGSATPNSTAPVASTARPARFVPSILWLAGAGSRRQQATSTQRPSAVFVDRRQQEVLAANPTLASASSSALLTRSDVPLDRGGANATVSRSAQQQQQQQQQPQQWQQSQQPQLAQQQQLTQQQQQQLQLQQASEQQLYRGYSLIELEVRSDTDRRYVHDLYGNLSAALNEQAANPNAASVSPYVDVDFWSFKPALDDHIDIMVSPKSRAFILGQLARARIRHRIKVDDIQSRLDAQQHELAAHQLSAPGAPPSGAGQLSGRGAGSPAGAAPSGEPFVTGGRADAPQAQAQRPALNESLFFDNYQRLGDINQYLEWLVERNSDVARVQVIGRSSQGRYLRVLRLGYEQRDVDGSTGPAGSGAGADSGAGAGAKPALANGSAIVEQFLRRQAAAHKLGAIWLDGGTHAREWISPATVLYLAFRLADNHRHCAHFFDAMRLAASQQAAAARAARATPTAPVDAELVAGINDINTELLGSAKPAHLLTRARTQLERTLELLAKAPQQVASEHACDLELDALLRKYTFYIMPVLNPDGYEYSHTHNRLWRKTRSTSSHPIYRHFCLGADPNRNYDARHGSTGSSAHPCSQTYGGAVPFTEPETRHQSNFVYALRHSIKMYITFHSYSQMILLPYSHSKQLAPDHKHLESVGQAAVKAIERTHGTVYRVGPSASILYTASGTAGDWAYEKAGIKYSYTIELRDTGTFGFLLPRAQIVPTGEETFNGLLAMIEQMEKNDNLLMTSKSIRPAQFVGAAPAPNASADAALAHVPAELADRAHSARPLENALDGSDSWATPVPLPSGVRDRPARPLAPQPGDFAPSDRLTVLGPAPEPAAPPSAHRLDDPEPSADECEPDAGYAFEGEGELMEPTRDNIVEAARISDAKLLGRLDHTRRIVQAAGLTASGRNYINSPLLASRTTPAPARRESSDSLVTGRSVAL